MPNRTIYLPDDLDQLSRELDVNLSRVVQQALRELAAARSPEELAAQVSEASQRVQELGIDWPAESLEQTRDRAGER